MEEQVDNQVKVPTKQHPQLPILELDGIIRNCLKVISSHGCPLCGHQPNNNLWYLQISRPCPLLLCMLSETQFQYDQD